MPLLLITSVLPFLAHDQGSAAAFLTCRHHNLHASIIPEFLSDEERVRSFCEARQRNRRFINKQEEYTNSYSLFVQTPLMQFSPSLVLRHNNRAESIIKSLLETQYFTCTLQRCSVDDDMPLTNDLLQGLSKVRTLTTLDLRMCEVLNGHMKIIINSFPSLETLTVGSGEHLIIDDSSERAVQVVSPPPATARTLRNLTLAFVDTLFVTQFVRHFTNLKKLDLCAKTSSCPLDLLPLTSSLPRLTDLSLDNYNLRNIESLKSLRHHLSSLKFRLCHLSDFSFLSNGTSTSSSSLPELTELCVVDCHGFTSDSFASLANAPKLSVLNLRWSQFNNECLKYLENMVHLRKLDLSCSHVTSSATVDR